MRKLILPVLSLLMLGACSNDTEKITNNAEGADESIIHNADLNISIEKSNGMLTFNS